jgi:hypothetical protein
LRHGSWPEASWVSAPVLLKRLRGGADTPLVLELEKRAASHSTDSGGSYELADFDAPKSVFLALAQPDQEGSVVEGATHINLLWSFRNFLIHEYREPGYAMEAFGEESSNPCYHGYLEDPDWHLLYPVGFFIALLQRILESLEAHYVRRGSSPFEKVYDTTAWQLS